jgi:hypothetical protein
MEVLFDRKTWVAVVATQLVVLEFSPVAGYLNQTQFFY